MILDIIIVGLISGSTYAILAIGFSLIFGVARIVNIAHTAFYMVASYIIYLGMYQLGFHPGPPPEGEAQGRPGDPGPGRLPRSLLPGTVQRPLQ